MSSAEAPSVANGPSIVELDGERRGYSHRAVFLGIFVSLLGAFAVAVFIFFRYVKYEPFAERHVPQEMTTEARLYVEQGVVYLPFRDSFMPLLETGRVGPESRVKHFERKTTIELGVDLRELVLAWDERDQWVVILGGHFRRDGVVEGAKRMLDEEGIGARLLGEPPVLVHETGEAFGVADDGALILASSADLLREALGGSSSPVDIPDDSALFFNADPISGACCGLSAIQVVVDPGAATFPTTVRAKVDAKRAPSEEALLAGVSGNRGDFVLLKGIAQLHAEPEADAAGPGGQAVRRLSGELNRDQFARAVELLSEEIGGRVFGRSDKAAK